VRIRAYEADQAAGGEGELTPLESDLEKQVLVALLPNLEPALLLL